mgnify:CR=1 FL=1
MATKPDRWTLISWWARLIVTIGAALLMIDDLQRFLREGRDLWSMAGVALSYGAAIALCWIPRQAWVISVLAVVAGAISGNLVAAVLAVAAAGYALAIVSAWWMTAIAGALVLVAGTIGVFVGNMPRAGLWLIPTCYACLVGGGAVVGEVRDALTRSADRVQALQLAESEIRQQERVRIARDLHDGIGQSLALISLTTSAASQIESVGELRASLDEAGAIAREAREQMHQLAEALAPLWKSNYVDESGHPIPSRVLASMAEKLEASGWHTITTGATLLDALLPATRDLCSRVVLEGTTNIIRHAGPGDVHVDVAGEDQSLTLTMRSPLGRQSGRPVTSSDGRGLGVLQQVAADQGAVLTTSADADSWAVRLELRPGLH